MISERLGPSNEEQIEYSVRVTSGKKIRFNVRDSIDPGYEGTAFTDVISINTSLHIQDEADSQLQEAITLASKAELLVPAPFQCKFSIVCQLTSVLPPLLQVPGTPTHHSLSWSLRYPLHQVAFCPLPWPKPVPLYHLSYL